MYMRFRESPPEDQRKVFARPRPSQWKKLDETPQFKNENTLREYQLEGVNWLSFCWYQNQNCILADEMGLGKTIQSISFLHEIYKYGIKGPFLVIVPLSTVGNWQREFETWTDMNVVVFHGSSISRNMIKEYELFYKDDKGQRIPDIYRFEALITTFEIILTDFDLLADIDWRSCIIDEAHRLKNKNCRLLEGLRLFDLEHRVLLTGTPLQNNTEELFSLLNFLNPNKFNSSESFIKEFGDLKTEEQVGALKEILKPLMLRRLKEDVEKNLAPKEETIIEVELTNIQKKYYRAILERNFQFLSKGVSNVPNLMNTMMELRKCCNHPFLINGAEEKIFEEAREKHAGNIDMMVKSLVQSCGKMVLMDKLLPRLKSGGHKVLIFSQMIRVLDIIEDYLIQRKYLYERLDGRIRGTVRQEAIDRFSKPDSDRFAFLLCTRAGGLGINLTAADTVVIYDSDWNPQNDLQAQARCHRIGQSKAVKVYRLITRNSYEREMFDKASLKLGLDKAVLQSMVDKPINPASQLTKKEIEDLLKKGAYGALMEDDNAGDSFCEEDIEQILQRRTKVIQIESEGKGSTFAKASFTMTENRDDIDINDPNFWQKWAKKADIDLEANKAEKELIVAEPRQRRQTNRYGNDDTTMEISDLESTSSSETEKDGVPKLHKKLRKHRKNREDEDTDYGNDIPGERFDRNECFKVEKLLLVYGWGRWQDLIKHGHFKRRLGEDDVMMIARAILAHSLKFYKGDDKIKEFIWDLISSGKEGELKNHSGLSAPVPRGRKGKKRKENLNFLGEQDKPLDFDPEIVLDNGYKRHLHRHSNKVLLRVRLLYYIKQELIGEEAEKVFQNLPHLDINIPQPILEGDLPAPWWDEEADKSLIIGVFKYGYEKFNCIRSDPALCFLNRCGPPDGAALLAEQEDDRDDDEHNEDVDDDENSQSSIKDAISEVRRTKSGKKDKRFKANRLKEEEAMKAATENAEEKVKDDEDIKETEDSENKEEKLNESEDSSEEKSEDNSQDKSEAVARQQEEEVQRESVDDAEIKLENNVKELEKETVEQVDEAVIEKSDPVVKENSEEKTDEDVINNLTEGNLTQNNGNEDDKETPGATTENTDDDKYLPFPDASNLNVRLRKCITNYQRHYKKRMLKNEQMQRKLERREKSDGLKDRDFKRKEIQHSIPYHYSRWTRREESDFYRTVSTFGVEFSRVAGRFRWDRFREQARLDKKHDDALTEYFHAFYFMCQRVCGKVKPGDMPPNMIFVEPITEERASRCLARIDLLNKIRQDILMHPLLEERVKVCQPSYDMPSWWICGQHDKELLIGAARHGVAKTDFNILRDKTLSFHLVLENSLRTVRNQPGPINTPYPGPPRMDMTSTPIPKFDMIEQHMPQPQQMPIEMKPDVNPLKKEEPSLHSTPSNMATMNLKEDGKVSGVKDEDEIKQEETEKMDIAEEKDVKIGLVKEEMKMEDKPSEDMSAEVKEEKASECKEDAIACGGSDENDTPSDSQSDLDKKEEKGIEDKGQPELSENEKMEAENSIPIKETFKIVEGEDLSEGSSSKDKAEKAKDDITEKDVCEEKDDSPNNEEEKEKKKNETLTNCKDKSEVNTETSNGNEKPEISNMEESNMGKDELLLATVKSEENDDKGNKSEGAAGNEDDRLRMNPDLKCKIEAQINKSKGTPEVIEVGDDEDDKPDYVRLKEKIIKTEIERIAEEKLRREREAKQAELGLPTVIGQAGVPGDEPNYEMEGLEPGEIAPTRYFGPAIEWPKDRVIFHRLEHVCYTIENGEWPFSRRPTQAFFPPGTPTHSLPGHNMSTPPIGTPTHDSRSETPVSAVLKSDSATGAESDQSEGLPGVEPFMGQRADALKMTFHKRGRGRRRKYEIDPDKVNRIQQLLNQSAAGALSSDDSQSESMNLQGPNSSFGTPHTPQRHLPASPLVTSSPSSSGFQQSMSNLMRSPMMNGVGGAELDQQEQQKMLEQGMFIPERKRRGRKRRTEKMAEMAMAEALAKREQARILTMLDPDTRIPMINLEDGSFLAGDDAPKKRDLEWWMAKHPGYMIDDSIRLLDPFLNEHSMTAGAGYGDSGSSGVGRGRLPASTPSVPGSSGGQGQGRTEDDEQMASHVVLNTPEITPETFVRRRGRKPQLDPRTLNLDKLTGNENVAVVDRDTGKKITGSKAPPLKHLKEWLDQNSSFDVEQKWGDLVRTKTILPKSMDHRILKPSGRGRKPREASMRPQQMMPGELPFPPGSLSALSAFQGAAAAGLGNFPKLPLGLPFGAMPGLPGLPNPFMGLQGLGLPGLGFPPHLVKAMEEEMKAREKELKDMDKESGGDKEVKEGRQGEENGSGEEGKGKKSLDNDQNSASSSLSSAATGSKSSSVDTHPSFPHMYFNPMMYNPLLAAAAASGGLPNFSLPTSLAGILPPGLVVPPQSAQSPVNGQQDSVSSEGHSGSSSSNKHHHRHQDQQHHQPYHHDKRRKHHHPQHIPEYPQQRSSPSIPQAHSIEDLSMKRPKSSRSTSPTSYQAQDLSVPRNSDRPPSLSSAQSQEEATDLSLKPKSKPSEQPPPSSQNSSCIRPQHSSSPSLPSASSTSSSTGLKVPGKNKIQGSLKLNRILDSLKDRVLKGDSKEKKADKQENASSIPDKQDKKSSGTKPEKTVDSPVDDINKEEDKETS